MLIDDDFISNRVFYPRKTPDMDILKFQVDPDTIIGGYIYIKNKELPTILLFHGNGEIALEYINFADLYFKIGVNLAVIDYRGYGFSSGKPFYTSLIGDSKIIFDLFLQWIDDHGFNDSIFIKGRSLGSVCASEIGSLESERIRGIIFESGFGSLPNVMKKTFGMDCSKLSSTDLKQFSNHLRMQKITKPVLIIHGKIDNIIPVEEARVIYDAIPENIKKKLILIDGAGHNDISSRDPVKYFQSIMQFIELHK